MASDAPISFSFVLTNRFVLKCFVLEIVTLVALNGDLTTRRLIRSDEYPLFVTVLPWCVTLKVGTIVTSRALCKWKFDYTEFPPVYICQTQCLMTHYNGLGFLETSSLCHLFGLLRMVGEEAKLN